MELKMDKQKYLLCEICKTVNSIYCCPKCDKKYCSVACFKNKMHELCSESFYREWVESSLNDTTVYADEKDKMIQILNRIHKNTIEDTEVEEFVDNFEDLNLDSLDQEALLQILTEKEKNEFESLMASNNFKNIIPVKEPWWNETTIHLVTEIYKNEKGNKISRPCYPLYVKKLSSITSKKASKCIKFNLVNILFTYAFINRIYNCDLRDLLEDVIENLYQFSPVLSEGKNYNSLEECINDTISLIMNSDLAAPIDFVKNILMYDVCIILKGPKNTRQSYFVLCALNDIKLIYSDLKAIEKKKVNSKKTFLNKLYLTTKKIEYYMSWSICYENLFSELAPKLVCMILPDFLSESVISISDHAKELANEKSLIEEIQ